MCYIDYYSFDDIATEDFAHTDYDGNLEAPYDNENTGFYIHCPNYVVLSFITFDNVHSLNFCIYM